MNILVLTTSYPSDAADSRGVFIHSVAKALRHRGHNLRVIVPGRTGTFGRREIDGIDVIQFRYALTERGHELTNIGGGIPEALRRSRWNAAMVPVLMTRFATVATRHAGWADVIWANWLGAGLVGGIASAIGGLRRRPMVVTLRGDDAYLIHDRPMWRRCGRWVFKRSAAVTAVSPNMVPLLSEALGPDRQVIVPTFGVDTEMFHPNAASHQISSDRVLGLFVGNISVAKGVDTLLKALAACDAPWRFMFVGDGPDLDAMTRLATELKLTDRLQWLGQLGPAQVAEQMRGCDFLALPSRSEGRPNVIMEAMASGLPVIATPVGSVPQIVTDAVENKETGTGLLIPVDDAPALTAAITTLCQDAALRRQLGANARAAIERLGLTWDKTAEEFEKIFSTATEPPSESEGRGAKSEGR